MVNAFATRELLNSSADLIARLDSFMPFCSTTADLMVPEAELLEAPNEGAPMVEMTVAIGVYDAEISQDDWPGSHNPDFPIVESTFKQGEVGAANSIVEIQEMFDVSVNADMMEEMPSQAHSVEQENLSPSPATKKRRTARGVSASSLIEEL